MLNFLQLSDIHFSGRPPRSRHERDERLRRGLELDAARVASEIGGVSAILVCGDVAFSADPRQYAQATDWLRNLTSRLDIDSDLVRVIPGNHDINRGVVKNDVSQRFLRDRLRMANVEDIDAELEAVMTDPELAPVLLTALEGYNAFAAQFGCEISVLEPTWERVFPLISGWSVHVHGLTSALISDEHDDNEFRQGRRPLVLGRMQLQPIVAHPRRIHLALCHHPFDWLRDGNELAPELADLAQLRITGHVHQHGLIVDDESVCLATGALQPPRNEDPWDPRYNFVCLDVETTDAGPRLAINVHARVWNGRRFVPDPQNHPDGIARARLTIDELTASDPLPDAPADVPPDFVDDSPRLRDHGGNLRYRLSVLPPSDRFTVASELGVASGLEGTVEYLQPRVVVRRCHARDILERLDEALSRYFGPTTRARPNNGGSNG